MKFYPRKFRCVASAMLVVIFFTAALVNAEQNPAAVPKKIFLLLTSRITP